MPSPAIIALVVMALVFVGFVVRGFMQTGNKVEDPLLALLPGETVLLEQDIRFSARSQSRGLYAEPLFVRGRARVTNLRLFILAPAILSSNKLAVATSST